MTTPCVGIFWGIRDAASGMTLLADKTPIDKGEQYGECITHPNGHYEFWRDYRNLALPREHAKGCGRPPRGMNTRSSRADGSSIGPRKSAL